MSITSYSLNQRRSIENHHSVEEQARQEEVQTGTKQPRQLQKERGEESSVNKSSGRKQSSHNKRLRVKAFDAVLKFTSWRNGLG